MRTTLLSILLLLVFSTNWAIAQTSNVNQTELTQYLGNLSLHEVNELLNALAKNYGVTHSAVTAVAPSNGGNQVQAQTKFDLYLMNFGSNKLAVIKAVREITGLGLKEAKDLVESAPVLVKGKIDKFEANEFKEKLIGVGADAIIK